MNHTRLALFALLLSASGLVVACGGSADRCGETNATPDKTAFAESSAAPMGTAETLGAAPSPSADPDGVDPCDSTAPALVPTAKPAKSCNCQPGDPLCSCL